ncbi:MAG TPA: sigma-70 family RNA polymerase sigma factor [Tepidisphaeraceae bacterium]|jgi:RNA polymerase sigma-70 factor (ECF subfamily)
MNVALETSERFDREVMPHLDAAYNLARWLTGDEHDGQDIVQESFLRAMRGFDTFRGGDARCWLLTIVRNTYYTWLARKRGPREPLFVDDDDLFELPSDAPDPSAAAIRRADQQMLREAIEQLPPQYREMIVLRELEGLSYKEISTVASVPIGTVMSRLARARRVLAERVSGAVASAAPHEREEV